jgi:hypothetical protein
VKRTSCGLPSVSHSARIAVAFSSSEIGTRVSLEISSSIE